MPAGVKQIVRDEESNGFYSQRWSYFVTDDRRWFDRAMVSKIWWLHDWTYTSGFGIYGSLVFVYARTYNINEVKKLNSRKNMMKIYRQYIKKTHTHTRTQQGRQWEYSVKTLRSLFSTEFLRHYVFSGGTQWKTLPHFLSEEMKIFNILFSQVENETTTVAFRFHTGWSP